MNILNRNFSNRPILPESKTRNRNIIISEVRNRNIIISEVRNRNIKILKKEIINQNLKLKLI